MKRDMGLHIHWGIVNESEANEDSKWFQDVVMLLLCCSFTSTVNNYGHGGTVS